MKLPKTGAVLCAAVLLLQGCSSTGKSKGENGYGPRIAGPEIGKYREGGGPYGAGPRGGAGANGAGAGELANPQSRHVVYFVYDSSEVQPQYLALITSQANYLAANPGKTVVLEGHADERGSPEYNIALSEQRAKAVAKLLKLQGAVDSQIQIVGFGEEKPEVPGHDDNAWQRNRRVEISYPGP